MNPKIAIETQIELRRPVPLNDALNTQPGWMRAFQISRHRFLGDAFGNRNITQHVCHIWCFQLHCKSRVIVICRKVHATIYCSYAN